MLDLPEITSIPLFSNYLLDIAKTPRDKMIFEYHRHNREVKVRLLLCLTFKSG